MKVSQEGGRRTVPMAVAWGWHLLLMAAFESNEHPSSGVATPGRFFQIPT